MDSIREEDPSDGSPPPDIVPEHVTRSFEQRFLQMEMEVFSTRKNVSEELKHISNSVANLNSQMCEMRRSKYAGGSYAEGRHDEWMTWKRWAALPEDVRPPSPVEPRLRLA